MERSNKYRRFNYSQSVYDEIDESRFQRIQFLSGHSDIVLDRQDFQLCGPNNLNYDKQLLLSPENWHQIIINPNILNGWIHSFVFSIVKSYV
ncbi:hypothetical protein PVAND_009771 [Polypedilum vanderplanki]|uniref:Uncharacterized protein n=1 Tax=Polypedilum vanderplanki TaxID=319348 RepID=A0A9J6CDI9_POLVA|nr:hypothetical protein PVAND_009771 [Polypedilum vanderplanki]